MIKKIIYAYKFLYYSKFKKFSFIYYFPFISIVIGTLIIMLTLGIMNGMEESIFKRMESFHFTYTGDFIDHEIFNHKEFIVYSGEIRKCLISKDGDYKMISITSLNNLEKFKNTQLKEYLKESLLIDGIIIGQSLAASLNLKIGDEIKLTSPLDIDLISINIPHSKYTVSGIFNYQILDYDYNYAFISNSNSNKIFENNNDKIFIKLNKSQIIPFKFIQKYNLLSWKEESGNFLKALKTEKLIYSSFGYLLIFVASLSSISLMSLFVIKKTKQIAILKALGCNDHLVGFIFALNAIITSIAGVLLGSLAYLFIILINNKYKFIQETLFGNLSFDFSIEYNFYYSFCIILISVFFMILSVIYPVFKIFNINLNNSINNKF